MPATVAPFVGAWIEILYALTESQMLIVAPFVGAWIEINSAKEHFKAMLMSLRSSERGLKCALNASQLGLCRSLRSSERGLKYVN